MPILKEFQPQIILVSCGFDACIGHVHPLGGYELTPTCKREEEEKEEKQKERELIYLYNSFCLL